MGATHVMKTLQKIDLGVTKNSSKRVQEILTLVDCIIDLDLYCSQSMISFCSKQVTSQQMGKLCLLLCAFFFFTDEWQ